MPGRPERAGTKGAALIGAGLSLALHAILFASLYPHRPPPPATPDKEAEGILVEMVVAEQDTGTETASATETETETATGTVTETETETPTGTVTDTETVTATAAVPAAEIATVTEPPSATAARSSPAPPPCLLPSSLCRPSDRLAGILGLSPTPADRITGELDAMLRSAAESPTLRERPRAELEAQADGSYLHRGPRVTTRILPNGEVQFSDTSGGPRVGVGNVQVTFDLMESLMRAHGEDPLRAERAWILAETAELRHRLERRAFENDGRHGLERLRSYVDRLVADRAKTTAEKKRELFEIWDDCAMDSVGAEGRAIVEEAVRRHLPEGTALAYTAAELARFNARRVGRVPFDPYRDADAGVPA